MDRKRTVRKATERGAADAVKYLRDTLHDDAAPDRSRIQAAEILLNRAYGRPGIADVETTEEVKATVKDAYADFLRTVSGDEF